MVSGNDSREEKRWAHSRDAPQCRRRKEILLYASGLRVEQVVSWFVNARKCVWRPAMRGKETRSAKPQRARATARQLHGQAGIALPKLFARVLRSLGTSVARPSHSLRLRERRATLLSEPCGLFQCFRRGTRSIRTQCCIPLCGRSRCHSAMR